MEQPKDIEDQYLDVVVAVERQSLQISKASKALNLMKVELDKLEDQRKQLRRKIVGEEESKPMSKDDFNKLASGIYYPPGAR